MGRKIKEKQYIEHLKPMGRKARENYYADILNEARAFAGKLGFAVAEPIEIAESGKIDERAWATYASLYSKGMAKIYLSRDLFGDLGISTVIGHELCHHLIDTYVNYQHTSHSISMEGHFEETIINESRFGNEYIESWAKAAAIDKIYISIHEGSCNLFGHIFNSFTYGLEYLDDFYKGRFFIKHMRTLYSSIKDNEGEGIIEALGKDISNMGDDCERAGDALAAMSFLLNDSDYVKTMKFLIRKNDEVINDLLLLVKEDNDKIKRFLDDVYTGKRPYRLLADKFRQRQGGI